MWDKANDDFVRIISAGIERIQRQSNVFEEPLSQELMGKLARVEAIMKNVKATFREQFLGDWLDDATKLTDEIGKWQEWAMAKIAPEGMPSLAENQILANLQEAGVLVAEDIATATWITPQGRGIESAGRRALAHHWEIAVDAGYLPRSALEKPPPWPQSIINRLLKEGWVRRKGVGSFEIWELSGKPLEHLEDSLTRITNIYPDDTPIYIDEVVRGISHHFRLRDLMEVDFRIADVLKRAEQISFRTVAPEIAKPAAETQSTVARLIEQFSGRWQTIIDDGIDEGRQQVIDALDRKLQEEGASCWLEDSTVFIRFQGNTLKATLE